MSDLYPTLSLGGQTPVPNDVDQNIIVPPLKSFSQWSASSGSEINDPMLSAQGYADYQRGHFFRTGELNDEVEGSITQGLVGSLLNNGLVTEEEVQAEGFLSTLKPESDVQTKTNLIRMAYGEEAGSIYNNNIQSDSANTEELDKQLNRAKTLLVESGSLPFARITDDKGVQKVIGGAGIENRGEALDTAVRLGGLDYSDAYRVMSGLEKRSGDTSTVFENIRQAELLKEFNGMLGSDEEQDDTAKNALDNMRELIKQKDIKPDLDQEGALSAVIGDMRKALSSSYSRRTGFGEGAALNRFSDKEIKDTIELLAANEVNEKGEFKLYDEDAKNIRILGSGHVLAHPALMQQKERFERAVKSDKRLSPAQATSLRNQRKLYRELTYEYYDKFLSETAATSDNWMEAKQAGRVKGLKDTDVLDSFIADDRNYSSIKNRLGDIAATVPDAVIGLFASLGAIVFKSEGATNYLVENQMDRQRRREVASIFGDDFGWGMDLSNVVAPMVVDISATAFLSATTMGAGGVAYAATKTTATSAAKLAIKKLTPSFVRKQFGDTTREAAGAVASKKALSKAGEKASTEGVQKALKEYNKAVGNKIFRKAATYPPLFLTAANRSAGNTYATVYAAQPDNMTHEEKHDAALGYAMMAGTVTGLITTAFMGLGRGGFEDAFLNKMSVKGLVAGLEKLKNLEVKGIGAAKFKEQLVNIVTKDMQEVLKKRVGNNIKAYGIPAMDEAMEEGLDEFVQTFIMDAALNEDTPMIDRLMTGLHAASLGGVMGAGVVGVRNMMDRGKGARFERLQNEKITEIIDKLEQSDSPLTAAYIRENREALATQLRTSSRSRETVDVTPEEMPQELTEAYGDFTSGLVTEEQFDEFAEGETTVEEIRSALNSVTKEESKVMVDESATDRESQAGSIDEDSQNDLQGRQRERFVDSFEDLWMDKEESNRLSEGLTAKDHHARFEQAKKEAEDIADFWGMEVRVDYNEKNKAKGALKAERTKDGMRLVMNPWGMSRLTMGLSRGNAQHVIRFEAAHEVIHHAAWRNLSKAEMDEIFSVLNPTQVNEIIDTYYDTDESRTEARNLLAPDAAPSKQRNMQHIIVDEFLRMKAQTLTKGYTTEEEIEFYKSNPNFVRIFLRYLRSYINRFNAMKEKDSENPVIAAALNRLAGEMVRLKGGYSILSTIKFDINDPENNLKILATYLDDRPITDSPDDKIDLRVRETQAGALNGQRGGLDKGNFDTDMGGIEYGGYAPLFELAFYETGPAKKRAEGMWRWLDWFTGKVDPRVKRLIEQRRQIQDTVDTDFVNFTNQLDLIIKEDFEGKAPVDLIQAIVGNSENITPETDPEFEQQLKTRRSDLGTTKLTKAETQKQRAIFVEKKKEEFRQRRSKAIEELAVLQNVDISKAWDTRLVKHLISLRELTNELSEEIKRIVGPDSPMSVAIDDNLDIYLHRKYRLFTDKEYRKNIREHEDYSGVRDRAATYLFNQFTKHNKNWLSLETREGVKLKDIGSRKDAEAALKNMLLNDYLDLFIKGDKKVSTINLINNLKDNKKSIVNLDIGALKNRQNPPQELRELLGQVKDTESGYGDLLQTFQHLGLVASQINFVEKLKKVGIDNKFIQVREPIGETADGGPDYGAVPEGFDILNIKTGSETNLISTAPFADGKQYIIAKDMADDINALLGPDTKLSQGEADSAAEFLTDVGAKLTGLSLGAKTLGSIGFYVRNIVSNVLFFGPLQGMWRPMQLGSSLKNEFIRKYTSMKPEEVSAFHRTLQGLGVIGNDINARLVQDLLRDPLNEKKVRKELFDTIDEIEKASGEKVKGIDKLSDKVGDTKVGKLYGKLRELSQTVDAFYKITYFVHELDVLQKARKYDQDNPPQNLKDPRDSYANRSDSQLMQEAAFIVKETAQSYDQAPPFVQGMNRTWYGFMFAPFIRFKIEVPRILLNTRQQYIKESASHNPIINKRGTRRKTGVGIVLGGMSALGAAAVNNILSNIGDEEDQALRDSMPEYLRTHTFFYYGKGDKLKSVDLTYVNPFAMMVDPFLRAYEQLRRGSPAEAGAAFFKTLVADQYFDQQIFAGALTSALNNRDPETGRQITEANDTAWEAFAKKFQFIWKEAYYPRTPENLLNNGVIKLMEGDPDAADILFTPLGALVSEFLPVRPYDIKLERQFDRFLSERAGEYRRANALKNRMYTDDSMAEGTVRGFADTEIERRRRINEHLLKTIRGFRKLGLSDEQIYSQATERGYGKRRMALLLNGLMERPALQTPFIRNMAVKGDIHIERLRTFQNQLETYGRFIPIEEE